jgi:hypothetical protein
MYLVPIYMKKLITNNTVGVIDLASGQGLKISPHANSRGGQTSLSKTGRNADPYRIGG